ncbi:MAG TPA: hypothetical protein VFG94_06115 [Acidimicrobiales bacterium]|jgi:hypothetical protein|nr:hypothetical protein [Acidimicrobiales bacterium]
MGVPADAAGHAVVVELGFFDEVAEAVRGLVTGDRVDMRQQARRWGLKAWFGADRPAREHYEAQVIAPAGVDGATVSALEIGFHAEHPDAAENDATIARLMSVQDRWRAALGDEAVVGPFLGRFPDWRRVSETWADPDLDDPDLPVQVALRLTDYIDALEPLRRGH